MTVQADSGSGFANLTKLGANGNANQLGRFEKQLMQEALKAEKEEAKHLEIEAAEEKALMGSMSSLGDGEGLSIGGANVGSLLGLGSADISEASAAYVNCYTMFFLLDGLCLSLDLLLPACIL